MPEQGYEYDQYAPQTGGRLFSSSMFGFNKEEVLEYLDELADENYQHQEAANLQIQDLTHRLQAMEAALADNRQNDVQGDAANEARHAEEQQQIARLSDDLEVAKAATQQSEEDLAEVREQLFNIQQENTWLREEFTKADTQIADMQRKLDAAPAQWADPALHQEMADLQSELAQSTARLQALQQEKEAALQEKETALQERAVAQAAQAAAQQAQYAAQKALREAKNTPPSSVASAAILADANAEADRIRATAMDERDRIRRQIHASAGGLTESITNLRGEVSGVETDVSRVLEAVQNSLSDVLSALGRTEQNLSTLSVQVDRFPASSPSVPKAQPQQVVYFQPGSQAVGSQRPRYSGKSATPETLGQGSFRQVSAGGAPLAANVRPFQPTYSTGKAATASAWPQAAMQEDTGEERIRALAENLVDTLVQMLT